jgi:hypothetical protein
VAPHQQGRHPDTGHLPGHPSRRHPTDRAQITAGRQDVAAGPYLYVTSRSERNWKGKLDVITVFDAKSGEVLEQIDTATMIVDMAVFGKDLALTTSEGLRFIALKK